MNQDTLNSISSYTSKLLRKNFGRGPQVCQATACERFLVVFVRGFISPMEEVLLQQGQRNQVERARTVIINHVLEELKGVIKISLDTEVHEYYHDWNFPNNTGLLMFVLEDNLNQACPQLNIEKPALESEVSRLSELVQKVPEHIFVYPISPSICIVERQGILTPIEKAIIAKGFADELILTKDELEKEYFHRFGEFDDIFHKEIIDIFIDWNFKDDKSLMGFILKT